MSLEVVSIIDIDANQPQPTVVHAKQYDTVRVVEAHLYDSGVKWYVPNANLYSMVSFRKSDHIGGFYDQIENTLTGAVTVAVTIDANDRSIIYIHLDGQIMTTPGDVRVDTVFHDTITGDRLGSFYFIVEVEEASVREVDIASSPYFNILAAQIAAVMNYEEGVRNFTASAVRLAPGATPTTQVTGGTSAQQPYNIKFGIPSMPTMTASATKLAPNATPTATLTGGQTAGQAYNIDLGIPSMPSMTASVQSLPEGTPPSVSVTGGSVAGQAYNLEFGIPYATSPTVTSIEYKYALSQSGTVAPSSGWVSSLSDLGDSDALKGKFVWSRAIASWSSGGQSINYACAYSGMDSTGSVTSVNGRDGIVLLHMDDLFTKVGQI